MSCGLLSFRQIRVARRDRSESLDRDEYPETGMNALQDQDIAQTASEPPLPVSLMGVNFLLLAWGRRKLIFRVTLLALLIGIAVALLWKPYYMATATVLPPQQSPSSPSGLLAQMGGSAGAAAGLLGGGVLKSPADVYVGFMRSETVEDALIAHFHLVERYRVKRVSEARKKLEAFTVIDAKEKDGFIRLSVLADTPDNAMNLANAYIDTTKELSQHLAIGEASQRRLFLEQQMEQAKNRLADAEEALKRTENATGVIQVEAQSRALIESANNLRTQIAAREVHLQSLRTFESEENSDVLQLQREVGTLRTQLASLNAKDVRSSGASGLTGSQGQLSDAGLQYARKLREVKYEETLFEILARQFEAAKLDEAREGNLLQVVDPARRPDYRAGPKRALIIAGFLAAGLIGSLGFVLLEAAYHRQLADPLIADRVNLLKRSIREAS